MVDQICIRFGAFDRRLAAAVRHALDTAVTHTALALMNAVHLRMTLIAEILDSEFLPEPPSHRWYEFMVECFGRNSIGLQNSAVWPSDSRSNAAALAHTDFVESYVTNETEDRIIHDLLVAAGAFLVAESTVMDEKIEQWNIAGRDGFVSEELCSIARRAGAVGFDLLEHAEAGTWRDLLSTTIREPDSTIVDAEQAHTPSASAASMSRANLSRVGRSSDIEDPDYVVLLVDSVEASHRQALTARALSELRKAANNYSESRRKDSVVVISAADGSPVASLPLTSQWLDKGPEEDSSSKRAIEHKLDQVAQLVEALSQPADGGSTIAASITRPFGEQSDLITGICSAVRAYGPVLLIILSSEYNSILPLDLRSKPDPGSSPKELVETLRGHGRLPDLHGVSIIFVCPAPSPETHLDAYWPTIFTAAGAVSCKFRFSPANCSSFSTSPAGDSFRAENMLTAPPAPPTPMSQSSKIGSRELPIRAEHGSPAIGLSGVHLCDEGPVRAPVDDEDNTQQADPSERVVSIVDPAPVVGGLLSFILADNRRIRRALIQVVSTAMIVVVVIVGIRAVRAMTDSILMILAGSGVMVLVCICVLIGSGLNIKSVDRRYRRWAQQVQYLNARDENGSEGYPAAIYDSCRQEIHQSPRLR